jgi:hypothetical protein
MKTTIVLTVSFMLALLALKLLLRSATHAQVAQQSAQQHLSSPQLFPHEPAPEQLLPPAPEWCDKAHKVPFVPADQCRGMSSCDRLSLLTMAGEPNRPIRCR